jgi:hypothetical protein
MLRNSLSYILRLHLVEEKNVFKKKLEPNDAIDKYMTYLVAKSYK